MAYLPLSTANLPDPAIDPAQGSSPEDYFNTVLYTGDSATSSAGTVARTITGVGFQPDLIWVKSRNNGGTWSDHSLTDSVRGNNLSLSSNTTGATINVATDFGNGGIGGPAADGFTIVSGSAGSTANLNSSGDTYVAWNWKANGSGVSNTDGSITSTVSANTTSGFSIVSYTGTNSATETIGHGLNQAPDMIIVKSRDSADFWPVYHKDTNTDGGENYLMRLNTTDARLNSNVYWNDTAPTSTVFTVGTSSALNNTDDFIAYCFHSVDGFSKLGSYTGNGSSDGPFVYTGFRPAFVMVKRTDGGTNNWVIYDKERDPYNYVDSRLFPNTSGSESGGGASYSYDFLSNGFKVRSIGSEHNLDGGTYIYMAFAENPFKYSNAR